jgi:hypothetical protein
MILRPELTEDGGATESQMRAIIKELTSQSERMGTYRNTNLWCARNFVPSGVMQVTEWKDGIPRYAIAPGAERVLPLIGVCWKAIEESGESLSFFGKMNHRPADRPSTHQARIEAIRYLESKNDGDHNRRELSDSLGGMADASIRMILSTFAQSGLINYSSVGVDEQVYRVRAVPSTVRNDAGYLYRTIAEYLKGLDYVRQDHVIRHLVSSGHVYDVPIPQVRKSVHSILDGMTSRGYIERSHSRNVSGRLDIAILPRYRQLIRQILQGVDDFERNDTSALEAHAQYANGVVSDPTRVIKILEAGNQHPGRQCTELQTADTSVRHALSNLDPAGWVTVKELRDFLLETTGRSYGAETIRVQLRAYEAQGKVQTNKKYSPRGVIRYRLAKG